MSTHPNPAESTAAAPSTDVREPAAASAAGIVDAASPARAGTRLGARTRRLDGAEQWLRWRAMQSRTWR